MNAERLALIRDAVAGNVSIGWEEELVALVDQLASELDQQAATIETLTRQLSDARDIAIRCGAFQNDMGADREIYGDDEDED